ncbi:hypothetical protein V1512DRAFT_247626 [Lipomyces arxii]|uniref:uncharacterized protein n=1 Tax=Lipomyces arxii TaxID=56418 RepID=UPI0034CE6695
MGRKAASRKPVNKAPRIRIDVKPRTRSGCITCRLRHKRCDERTPTCMNCENINVDCGGYLLRLKWNERMMRKVDIPATSYPQIRYVNFTTADFTDKFDQVLQQHDDYDFFQSELQNNVQTEEYVNTKNDDALTLNAAFPRTHPARFHEVLSSHSSLIESSVFPIDFSTSNAFYDSFYYNFG